MRIAVGIGVPVSGAGGYNINADPLLGDWWNSKFTSTVTVGTGGVSDWRSVKNGLSAEQATEANRPEYANGQIVCNGTADVLIATATGPLPAAAAPSTIIAVLEQDALPADTSVRYAFAYGGSAGATVNRAIRRAVSGGVNIATGNVGNGTSGIISAAAPGDFSGRRLVVIRTDATSVQCIMDGAAGAVTTVSGGPATGTDRICFGANTSLANFWAGKHEKLAVFNAALTDEQLAVRAAYLWGLP